MKALLLRIVLAAVLVVGATGCRHMLSYDRHGRVHRSPGTVAIVAGVLLGTAIRAAASGPPEPERTAPSRVYYVYGPPHAPMPRPARDVVEAGGGLRAFDPAAARAALNGVDVSSCRPLGAPRGFGHARATVNPDGIISKVVVDDPAGMSAEAVQCIGDRIGAATVPPFKGSMVTMGTTYHVR